MDYRLKQAYERVYANEKPLTPRITNLAEAYSHVVCKKGELLEEAMLSNTSNANSLRGYLQNLQKLLSGNYPKSLLYQVNKFETAEFIPASGQTIKFNATDSFEDLKKLLKSATLEGTLDGKSATINVGKLVKTFDIKQKQGNVGDVIEGVLAAAIFVKLTSEKDAIDASDIKDVISHLKIISPVTESLVQEAQIQEISPKKPNSRSLKAGLDKSVKGSGEVWDKFTLSITLKKQSMDLLLNFSELEVVLGPRLNSVLAYVNEEVSEFAKNFRNNGELDYVKVIADGVSKNTETKVDVSVKFVTYDENNIETESDVEHFQLSVKTNKADLIGQKAGGGRLSRQDQLEILYIFWAQLLPEPYQTKLKNRLIYNHHFNKLNVLEQYSQIEMYKIVYGEANNIIGELLKAGNKENVPQLIFKNLLENLKKMATSGQKSVKLVQFEEKEYFVLNFDLIEDWIKNNYLFLDNIISFSDRGLPTIQVRGTSFTSTEERKNISNDVKKLPLLFKVRVFAESEERFGGTNSKGVGYIRNYVEKGPLLTQIVKQQKKKESEEENKNSKL